MILTVTLNPSIDVSYPLDSLTIDGVNRISEVSKTPGGKGLNVSRVLQQLGGDLVTTGFIGGQFGDFIRHELDQINLKHDYQNIDGQTRTCIAILHDGGKQTEILESGPEISAQDSQAFKNKFADLAKQASTITMSGSLPKGLAKDYYNDLIKIGQDAGARVLLDTSGQTLTTAVNHPVKPYLIKPNEEEVKAITGSELDLADPESIKSALTDPSLDGIDWLVVSLGKDGAVAKLDGSFYRVTIPTVQAVNPVGSGDSTIAGFAKALDDGKPAEEVLKTGMTCGVLNAMSSKTGDIDPDKFDEIYSQVEVENL